MVGLAQSALIPSDVRFGSKADISKIKRPPTEAASTRNAT